MDRRIFLGVATILGISQTTERPSQVKICLGDGGNGKCRYLDEIDTGPRCLKLLPEKRIVDEEIADYVRLGMPKQNFPFGDNCEGRVL